MSLKRALFHSTSTSTIMNCSHSPTNSRNSCWMPGQTPSESNSKTPIWLNSKASWNCNKYHNSKNHYKHISLKPLWLNGNKLNSIHKDFQVGTLDWKISTCTPIGWTMHTSILNMNQKPRIYLKFLRT